MKNVLGALRLFSIIIIISPIRRRPNVPGSGRVQTNNWSHEDLSTETRRTRSPATGGLDPKRPGPSMMEAVWDHMRRHRVPRQTRSTGELGPVLKDSWNNQPAGEPRGPGSGLKAKGGY